uniref:Ig-like domain protein n=1 Tax=Siphoviridae sp. ct0uL16 TaxID=2825299 RepID=A0A8S5Q4J4_9CAUD|nr:MAG TPA: Ig-like domain protein [Siphoviridae sp. ct0uL16]
MAIKSITATINGQAVTLTLNAETGKYEAQVNAPAGSSFNLSGGYYPVSLRAEDTAGNVTTADSTHSTLGESLRLFVKEKVKPIITILAPSAGAYVTTDTPEIKFKVTDNTVQTSGYSGIKKESCVLKIGSAAVDVSKITWSDTEGGFIGTYTPEEALADGNQTITVDIKDNDDNSAETASCTFKIDTVAPTLVITAPAEGLETNKSELTVTGTTDDVTSKPVVIAVKLNGTDCGAVEVGADGAFSKAITLDQQGENTIVISATDKAGKVTSITRTVTYNTTAPVIKSVTITPNPVNAGTLYKIVVEVE